MGGGGGRGGGAGGGGGARVDVAGKAFVCISKVLTKARQVKWGPVEGVCPRQEAFLVDGQVFLSHPALLKP